MPACPVCHAIEMSDYCRTTPLCVECKEDHAGSMFDRCRDCSIQYHLDTMQCSKCTRMRYVREENTRGTGGKIAVALAESLWGARCECDPLPPTIAEVNDRERASRSPPG